MRLEIDNSKNTPAEEIQNPEVKEAIDAMQEEGSKENIDKMITAVVNAKFILPAKVRNIPSATTNNGHTVMGNQTQVQFRMLENNNHEKFFGVFTDVEEMNKWQGNEEAQKVVTDFDSISQMIMDPQSGALGFVINAFGKSVVFPKPMVISIKQQKDYMAREENTLKNGAQVKFGEPEEYPIELMGALINHFKANPGVNAAFLRMVEQDGEMKYFIVIDFIGDTETMFNSTAEAAKPFLDEDEIGLTMMPFSMEFARNAVNGVEPFYKKES